MDGQPCNDGSSTIDWKRSLRVALINGTHACRLWSASDVMLLEPWEVEGHPYIAQLGPDIADLLTTVASMSSWSHR